METRSTILVVDDTPDVAAILREVLESDGHRVLVAQSLELGLQILRAFKVALVLTDALGGTAEPDNNWSDLDQLAVAARTIPLVLYAPDEPERYADFAAHGFAARLTEPLNLDALLPLVGSLLLRAGQDPTVAHGPTRAREG